MTDGLGAQAKSHYDLSGRIWKEEAPTRTVVNIFDNQRKHQKAIHNRRRS